MTAIRCLVGVVYAEILSLLRNRTQAFIFLCAPFLIFFFLTGIYREPVILHVPTVILDLDQSLKSREVIEEIGAGQVLEVTGYAADDDEVNRLIESGKARVAIIIPQDFEEVLGRGGPARILTVIDGSNMVFTNVASTASGEVVNQLSAQLRAGLLASHGMLTDKIQKVLQAVQFTVTAKYNPTYNYAFFLLFGLGINIVQQTYLLGAATVISREKERGTWRQYQMIPANCWLIVAGKLLPYFIIGVVQLSLLFALGRGLFGLPLKGSLLLLLTATVAFLTAVSAFALLISAVTRTVNSIRFTMVMAMPSFVLSGYTWPLDAMHPVIKAVAQCLPLTWYLKAFQSITMKEAGWDVVWPCLLYLVLIAVFCFSLSALWITKQERSGNGFLSVFARR